MHMKKIIALVSFAISFWSAVFPAPAVEAAPEEKWIPFEYTGNGVIYFPETWNVVKAEAYFETASEDDGIFIHSQKLLTATHIYNNSFQCTLRLERQWFSDDATERFDLDDTDAKAEADWMVERMVLLGGSAAVVDKPSPRQYAHGIIWRSRFSMDADSESLQAITAHTQRNGFLYTLTMTYAASDAPYWASRFEKIMGRWVPGDALGEIRKRDDSEAWRKFVLKNAGTVYLPASWTPEELDRQIEKIGADAYMQISLNTGISGIGRDGAGAGSLVVTAIWDARRPISSRDEKNLHRKMLEKGATWGNAESVLLKQESFRMGAQSVPLFTHSAKIFSGIDTYLKSTYFRHEDNMILVYLFCVGADGDTWDALLKEILSRWEVAPPRTSSETLKSANWSFNWEKTAGKVIAIAILGGLINLYKFFKERRST